MSDLRTELQQAAGPPRPVDMDGVLRRARERSRRQWSAALGTVVAVAAILALSLPHDDTKPPPVTVSPTVTPTPDTSSPDPFTQEEYGGFETIDKPRPGQVRATFLDQPGTADFPASRQRVFVIGHPDGSVTVADAETRTQVSPSDSAIVQTQVGWCPSTRTLQDLLSGEQWTEFGLSYRGGVIGTHVVRDSLASPGRLDVTRGSAEGGPDTASPPRPARCPRSAMLLHDNAQYPVAPVDAASHATDYRRVEGYLDIALDRVLLCAGLSGGRCAAGVRVESDTVFAYDSVEAYVLHGTFLLHRGLGAGRDAVAVRLPDVRLVSRVDAGARHVLGFVHGVTMRGDGSADLSFDSVRYFDGSVAEEGAAGAATPVPAAYNGLVTNDRGGLVTYRTTPGAPVYSAGGARSTLATLRDQGKLYWLVLDRANVVIRVVEQGGL